MHDPAIENLGVLARTTHDRAIGLPAVYAEALIRRSTRYAQAQKEMSEWKPYQHANVLPVMPVSARKLDLFSVGAVVFAALAFVGLMLQ